MAFWFTFCPETFILDYWEKTWTENQQLFDGIIDVTLFDGVEGLAIVQPHLWGKVQYNLISLEKTFLLCQPSMEMRTIYCGQFQLCL